MQQHQANIARRLAVFIVPVLTILLLVSCGTPVSTQPTTTASATAAPPPLPTSVTVLRFGGEANETHVAPFQMTSSDTPKVVDLYKEAHALPSPSFPGGCVQDLGIGYELSFVNEDKIVLQVLLRGGCPLAELSDMSGCRKWTSEFTAQIAATLGVPVATLKPPSGLVNTASPNGPFAPFGPTPPILVSGRCL